MVTFFTVPLRSRAFGRLRAAGYLVLSPGIAPGHARETHMNRTARIAVLGATALVGAAVLAGCSSSSSDSAATAAASPAASAAASSMASMSASEMAAMSASPIGGDVLPPVMVDETATTATAKVGDTIVFAVKKLAGTTIATDNADLFELTQGGEKDGAEFNPAAKALAAGTGVVTVTNPDASTRNVTITVTQ